MVTGDDLAFVRLAMRKRLVSAQRIREAVERKKWDSKERTLAEILVDMGALDPAAVKKLASEVGALGRQTVSSGRGGATVVSRRTDPGLAPSGPAPQLPADEKTEADHAPKHPRRVGRYDVIRLIGAGAMGAVYEARDRELDRTIALKLLAGEGAPSARAIARFRREAKLAARLDHPNIVRVYGAGFEDNHHFIAMDLVDGRSLAELVAIGEVSPRRSIHLARKIALAMQHAHERGVLHRDLKPANVLVDEKGEPRVTDFGLAVLAEPDESDRLTRTGAAVGTPAYMSPEQARGDLPDIDARSDVYALGATLYEMLTGGPPFEAPTFLELAKKICELEPVSPRKKNAEVPEDLATICLKALEKEKDDRYQSATEMAEDLARLIDDAPIVAKPPSPATRAKRWAVRHPGYAATILALVLLNIAGAIRVYLQPGLVTIYTLPPGAKVFIDSAYVGTNVVELPVAAGRHELKFGLENYDPTPLRLDVDRGHNAPFFARLIHEKGTVSLKTIPDGAHVVVTSAHDGAVAATGVTPFEKLLAEGDYVVRIEAPGYASPAPVPIHVEKGTVLEKGPFVLARDRSVLELEVEPRGAVVHAERGRVAQELVASGGALSLRLGEGSYDIAVSKIGYLPRTFTARVPAEKRRRATLAPLRASGRPLAGRVCAKPVVADLDGDGAPDVLVLEEDDDGHWLTLLGGGEEGARWRVRTEANAILPLLGDVDQDGVLDVALATPSGIEVREGANGARVLALEVGQGDGPGDPVRTAVYRTRSPQGVRSIGCVALRYGAGDAINVRAAVWVDGAGFREVPASCPELRAVPSGSAPVVLALRESIGADDAARSAAFVALDGKVARIDLPTELPAGLPYVPLHAKLVDVRASTARSQLATVPLSTKEREALLVCSESALVAVDSGTGRELARFTAPRSARLADPRVVPLEKGGYAILVREGGEGATAATLLVRWNALRGEMRDEPLRLERDDAVLLPADEAWASPARRRDEPLLWARGTVFDLRGDEVKDRSAESQTWAQDRDRAVADLDGSGSAQVIAPAPDGRSVVALAPLASLRWRAPGWGAVATAVGDVGGERALVAVGPEWVEALSARDGRTLWKKPAPPSPRGVCVVKTRDGGDVVVLAKSLLQRLDGHDGRTVKEAKLAATPATIAGLGADTDGCGVEDVLLGDPLALVSGATLDIAKQTGGPLPEGAQACEPVVVAGERGPRRIVARVVGEAGVVELVRVTTGKGGWTEDGRSPINLSTGPLAALAPVTSGGTPGLALVDAGALTFLGLDGRAAADPLDVGRVVAARATSEGPPVLVLVGEDREGWVVRGVARAGDGGELAWARRLPMGRRAPSGPVFLDHGARVALLAPTGSIWILSTKDGAWLGERRAPEGDLAALLAGYDLPEAGGATLVALAGDGDLVAFETATRGAAPAGEPRLELRELARRLRITRAFAAQAVDRLSDAKWEKVPAAQFVLAQARLAVGDSTGALRAVDAAVALAGKHPAAEALRIEALVEQARTDKQHPELPIDRILVALGELVSERPELAAETAFKLAKELADDDFNAARRIVEVVAHAAPTDPNARELKAALMLRRIAATQNDATLSDKDRLRQVQWLREDVLVALSSPSKAGDSNLRGLAAIAAFTLGSENPKKRETDDAEFRLNARQVHDDIAPELAELERQLDPREPRRFDAQQRILARIAQRRPEWSALIAITKRSVASREAKSKQPAGR